MAVTTIACPFGGGQADISGTAKDLTLVYETGILRDKKDLIDHCERIMRAIEQGQQGTDGAGSNIWTLVHGGTVSDVTFAATGSTVVPTANINLNVEDADPIGVNQRTKIRQTLQTIIQSIYQNPATVI